MKKGVQSAVQQHIVKQLYVEESVKNEPAEQIGAIAYLKAQETMQKLFDEFDGSNIAKIPEIASELSSVIIDSNATLKSITEIMSHDYYTHTHSINVAIYSMLFAKFKTFDRVQIEQIGIASLLHDLGKITVEKEIITKNAKLTTEELEEIIAHPSAGYELAITFGVSQEEILLAIKHHHEKIDGSGYPDGLKHNDIPYFARIICVCDIFDALTSTRSYKKAFKSFEALLMMRDNEMFKGKLDKNILSDFIKMLGN